MPGYYGSAFFAGPGASRISVPCPLDAGAEKEPWWADRMASRAAHFRRVGFDWILWPPLCKGSGGVQPTATGYDCFDPYDIGSKDQRGAVATRFGTAERVQRAIAILNRNGIRSWADVVLHQRSGGNKDVFKFKGAPSAGYPEGVPDAGRWPLDPSCFHNADGGPGTAQRDSVPDPANDFPFGAPCVYQHSEYMRIEAKRWLHWYTARLDFGGVRIDDCKGLWIVFLRELLGAAGISGLRAMGEYFDGSPDVLHDYAWQGLGWYPWGGMNGRMSMLDFSVHWHLKAVLDGAAGMYALRTGNQWSGRDGWHGIPFVDTPDTDASRASNQQIATNKRLAYAYLYQHLPGDGISYHRDYSGDANCYGLGPHIDNFIWCNNNLCGGPAVDRHVEHNVLVTERLGRHVGKPGSLAGINVDGLKDFRGWVDTSFGAFAELKDYNGNGPDLFCDRHGRVELFIPHTINWSGNGHVCYGPKGVGDRPRKPPIPTRMIFEGAPDLDIAPIANGAHQIQRIWTARGTPLEVTCDLGQPLASGSVKLWVAAGSERAAETTIGAHDTSGVLHLAAPIDGWVTIGAEGTGLPDALSNRVTAQYHATEELA